MRHPAHDHEVRLPQLLEHAMYYALRVSNKKIIADNNMSVYMYVEWSGLCFGTYIFRLLNGIMIYVEWRNYLTSSDFRTNIFLFPSESRFKIQDSTKRNFTISKSFGNKVLAIHILLVKLKTSYLAKIMS